MILSFGWSVCFSQEIPMIKLIEFQNKNNLDAIQEYVKTNGWEFEEFKGATDTTLNSISWIYGRSEQDDNDYPAKPKAKAFLDFFYQKKYESDSNCAIWYQYGSSEYFVKTQSQIKSKGFSLYKIEPKEDGISTMYGSDKTMIIMSEVKRYKSSPTYTYVVRQVTEDEWILMGIDRYEKQKKIKTVKK